MAKGQGVASSSKGGGRALARQCVAKPDFTIGTLRKAIPAHCFERSVVKSFSYLLADLCAVAALYGASTLIDGLPILSALKYLLLWPLYWFFQGAVCTGVWVIAHECGHQAFSDYGWLNDLVGLTFHSLLLVPYYAWKHSHRRHHSATGNVDRDEVFVPEVRSRVTHQSMEWDEVPLVRAAKLAGALSLGWPLYLLCNVSGRPYPRVASHFDPWSPIFSKRERKEIVVSNAALLAVASGLVWAGRAWGWGWLLRSYGVPYLVVNAWLVTITLYQHTHPSLAHYADADWDWLRGALSTVDRSYGFLDTLFHHITDTHVAHHLFSAMPHYHAAEATAAIRPILGRHYSRDDRPIYKAAWADWCACRYVVRDDVSNDGLWFH